MSEQSDAGNPLDDLVRANDLDGLVRLVEQWCTDARWDDLVRLRERCRREAADTGRQLWPAAALAEYRLALLAPGPWAAAMVLEASGRFVAGPLTEVAAARHTWRELVPHLGHGPQAAFVAHERVLRGEDLRGEPVDPQVLEVPLALTAWEPQYALADYGLIDVAFPAPPTPAGLTPTSLPLPGVVVDDDDAEHALHELVGGWLTGSDARLTVVSVDGDDLAAVAALLAARGGRAEQVHSAVLPPSELVAWLGWIGATGGAHGRRRGAATGRFGAWWALTALTGLEWPEVPEVPGHAGAVLSEFGADLGEAVGELRCRWWAPVDAPEGWAVRLAVHDPVDGAAWAVELVDQ